jgi:hypothetical protein
MISVNSTANNKAADDGHDTVNATTTRGAPIVCWQGSEPAIRPALVPVVERVGVIPRLP